MTHEQRLALDACECFVTAIKRLHDLQRQSDLPPLPIVRILFAVYAVPRDLVDLGDAYSLDFRRQVRTLKA
jgi:hypothetical protein